MSLRLNGSTSGYVEIDAPAVAGTTSITIPATTGELAVKATDGSVDLGGVNVDSSGRLLVGTSSAQGDFTLQIQGDAASAAAAGSIYLRRGLTTAQIGGNVGADLGSIDFGANDGTIAGRIECLSDATWSSTSDTPGRLVFSTTADGASSPTERMRVGSNGRVNIGGTGSLNAGFTVDWPANALEPVVINDTSNTAGQTHRISFRTGGTETGKIISGTTLGTSYVTSSDYRLKQGIIDLECAGGRLAQLKPRRFSFINSPEIVIDGFIAHEVQDVVPEAITGEKDAVDEDGNPVYQGIDHSRLVPLLTAALQEAVAKIETLEGMVALNNMTIDEYQHQLSSLSARITALEGGN